MVLSKREQVLALAAILVLAVLALNEAAIKPLSKGREQTTNEKLELEAQIAEAQNLFNRRRMLERKWKGLLSEGLRNDADAESRVARAAWAALTPRGEDPLRKWQGPFQPQARNSCRLCVSRRASLQDRW